MTEQAITTIEELPAELRAELVAKREAGTTLAELKKAFPQVTSDVIRAVLPPRPKGAEPKPAPRKPRATKPAQTAKPAQAKPSAEAKPATNAGTTDKERLKLAAQAPKAKAERAPVDGKLAQRAVTMRGKLDDRGRPTSWAKIGYALKLVPEGAPKSQAGDAARRAYRQVKGEDAPTGPSDY
jgi:primosomal protein N'